MRSEKGVAARKRDRSRESGLTIVEYAFLITPVAMITLGAFDFGRAYFDTNVLLDAAQAGVRNAVLPGSTTTTATAAANAELNKAGLQSSATVTATVTAVRGSTSSVTVSIPFKSLTGTLFPGWVGTHTLTKTASQRHE